MNTKGLAGSSFTAEERFRLIFAAEDRGDEVERARLETGAQRIQLETGECFPWATAFNHASLLAFLDLSERASMFHGLLELAAAESSGPFDDDAAECSEDDAPFRLHILMAGKGHELRILAEGWQLFCERLNIPPFVLWRGLPGFGRVQRLIELADACEDLTLPIYETQAAEAVADEFEATFRRHAKHFGA